MIRVDERKPNYAESWLASLMERRNKHVAAVALANKNARTIWVLLANGREYETHYGMAA